jgi:hypothetical protein
MRHAAKFMPPAPQRRYETNTNGLIQRFPKRQLWNGGTLSFDKEFSSTARFTVSGKNDAIVLRIANELELRLTEFRPWYSWLARISPIIFVPIIFIILSTISVWHRVIVTKTLDSRSLPIFDLVYLSLPFVAIYGVAIIYSNRVWEWLFPKIWFSIGRQQSELQRREKARGWIFGGILLALVIGVIGNLIAAALLNK